MVRASRHSRKELQNPSADIVALFARSSVFQGSATGQLWNDTISLAGHSLDNQTVALCDEVSGTLLGGNASGIMGELGGAMKSK